MTRKEFEDWLFTIFGLLLNIFVAIFLIAFSVVLWKVL